MDSTGEIVISLFIIANIVWFVMLNNQYSKLHPTYKGGSIWSIFFFLPFFILFSVYNIITSGGWTLYVDPSEDGVNLLWLSSILTIVMIAFFNKLTKLLLNSNTYSIVEALQYLKGMMWVNVAGQIIFAFYAYTTIRHLFQTLFDSLGFWYYILALILGPFTSTTFFDSGFVLTLILIFLVFQLLLDWLVYNAVTKKIHSLNSIEQNDNTCSSEASNPTISEYLAINNPYYASSACRDESTTILKRDSYSAESSNQSISAYEELKELKKLYDDGILSYEEFSEMKIKILKKTT